ncbi:MAG: YifB family Mg chelatase-like AAA ATPase [Acidimicrobiales bacterium]
MLAIVRSATLLGVRGTEVRVEVHVSPGLPGFTIVGLPDTSCREARDRVRAALLSTGLKWPETRTTVNLAPSGIRKVGCGLDLAIAVGVLVATEQLPPSVCDSAYLGELGLDGTVRRLVGAVPLAAAIEPGELVVAEENGEEAELVGRHVVRPVSTLRELVSCLAGDEPWSQVRRRAPAPATVRSDLSEVRGNRTARFALEVAAAGGHHLLFVGPPGAGKTMLAERLGGILEPLDDAAAIEVTTIHSAAGETLPPGGLMREPPFRAPHHTVSHVALVGGGSHTLRPGEISLAHGGVLFLDEMGEFGAVSLDALRQPLEAGLVRISRAHASATIPASFQLIASMNPCPCGFAGGGPMACRCSAAALGRYARRVSGPLLDRFDLRLRVEATESRVLLDRDPGEPSAAVAARVARARARARARGVPCNRFLPAGRLDEVAPLSLEAEQLLGGLLAAGRLSGRGLRRVRNVALTLDDLREGSGLLDADVVAQAVALRADLRFGEALGVAS